MRSLRNLVTTRGAKPRKENPAILAAIGRAGQAVAYIRGTIGMRSPGRLCATDRLEHEEQAIFFAKIKELRDMDPRFALAVRRTSASMNGQKRSKSEQRTAKKTGLTAGISDVFLALPSRHFHGLYIELKTLTGTASEDQAKWIAESLDLGYAATVARGALAAFDAWTSYVEASFP